ncbi:RNA polymerase sigma factor SigJ [Labrenzia sp. PHM005]|uniref:RNA polymerase sigma factor SigJ n=1 Tax=Labrenzia sp. PHM005 TaxID=2590016 RepID=UPI0011406065|nr:RNA polymerase sigma factor SigJ [Labrenzia sp. PHM005]QDG75227.1 sigma-70 family RNA polymerase sigma factor [Labrenzia sp. PHM005]
MSEQDKLDRFELARPRLLGLAYRLLGSWADAEDAVQDTFLRWQDTDAGVIHNPDGWLTTACTNRCLDILKSAGRQRVDYVGPWLPEPLQTETVAGPEERLELASSLTTAFLLLLERLSPKERAAYLLREIFDHPYNQIAETLDLSESACRQLVSRAGRVIGKDSARYVPSEERQSELLSAFQNAIRTGSLTTLSTMLSEDIELHTDGGGKVRAALRILNGRETIEIFLRQVLCKAWPGYDLNTAEINGRQGLIASENGEITAVLTAEFGEDGKARQIFIMRNPEKLRHFMTLARHEAGSGELKVN